MGIKRHIAAFLQTMPLFDSKSRRKKLILLCKSLPSDFNCYTHNTVVTFAMATEETNVSHSKFAELFGVVRELYGLNQVPNFKKELGKSYMLKTRSASYHYIKDFYFGDTITSKMIVASVSPIGYKLMCFFLNGDELHGVGEQEIVYTDMSGMPKKMPNKMKMTYEMVCHDL